MAVAPRARARVSTSSRSLTPTGLSQMNNAQVITRSILNLSEKFGILRGTNSAASASALPTRAPPAPAAAAPTLAPLAVTKPRGNLR